MKVDECENNCNLENALQRLQKADETARSVQVIQLTSILLYIFMLFLG
jgi:hypothetical protein